MKATNHNIIMRMVLRFILLFFLFCFLFVLPAVLLPLHIKIENQSQYNSLMIFLVLLVSYSVIIYLIKRINLWSFRLFLAVAIIFWGLQTFMSQLETWYFIDAMPMITHEELRNLFLRPLITSITFIPLAIWILGKWKQDSSQVESHTPGNLSWKKILSLSAAYVIIYFVFGQFVAWQFEAVRIFYSGSSANLGFIGGLIHTAKTDSMIFLFQFLRGCLWVVIGWPIILYLKGSVREKIIACTILYATPVVQLLLDNPFMPQSVRMAHLLEVGSSNALFGFLIGYVSTRSMQRHAVPMD